MSARFNAGGDKLYLLAEMLLVKFLDEMSPTALGQVLFTLAHAKRAVRAAE